MMLKIGLTGGIASGKSTVSDWLRNHNYHLIDADRIARDVVIPGSEGLRRIAAVFGDRILLEDGRLNRSKLGNLIFHNEDQRKNLNRMIHPLIRTEMRKQLKLLETLGAPVVFLDVPLLFEGSFEGWTDKTIVVYATKDNQIQRLMTRNSLTKAEALSRINTQMPLEEKKKRASAVIDNNGTIRETEEQLVKLLKQWMIM
ncbi:dephospho-CoA kinase [Sporolactobacillus pectinivorans]|uniref:dephospho-CoA kinase n=1 Tax=Sporolactobacillus pectinivorans TaxID=1591408 RepID=UPI001873C065|nr:dephospho-CoA kinase [Sporolactobacillus pectinivorans]